jgi:hypothetical protein
MNHHLFEELSFPFIKSPRITGEAERMNEMGVESETSSGLISKLCGGFDGFADGIGFELRGHLDFRPLN